MPREPSAAPYHDWNARIVAESYRPNAFARIVDDRGRVVAIVNNYEHLSFDFGPTLLSWLEDHAPEAYRRVLDGDAKGGGGIAQAFFHVILPLATDRDIRTHVRWGMAEFQWRFNRPAAGIWLPETAVNDRVLAILAEEGVGFTILAPSQSAEAVDTRRAHRWSHEADGARSVDVIFYDGELSHSVAFELSSLSSQALLDQVEARDADGAGLVTIAADGETFGHHHVYGDRLLAYALAVEAPRRGIEVVTVARFLHATEERQPATIIESAWSCAHGVERWRSDCGCSTGGPPGWNQRWRAPLRAALDLLRDAIDEVFERRGSAVLRDPWSARDAYVRVLIGAITVDEFLTEHALSRDADIEALTLLEAQRHSLAMFTSCGWFFNDLAGLETVQVMRYAARAMDLVRELGEEPPFDAFIAKLGEAESNDPAEGNGRDIWARHVDPVRVDARRVVAHLALVELLEHKLPPSRLAAFNVEVISHNYLDGGAIALCSGHVALIHHRTRRRTEHVYVAIHLGGLEVLGATRLADPARDAASFERVREAFSGDAPVTTLLRLVSEEFGPEEFGLSSALPDAADQILQSAARTLADRFAGAYERLYADHRPTLKTLAAAGYVLPPELRAPAELALARRLEGEVAAHAGSLDPADYEQAIAIAREAKASGYSLDTPAARATLERLVLVAVERAAHDPEMIDAALTALALANELGINFSLERSQEVVAEALAARPDDENLRRLATALNLAL